ncbi:phosphoribosyltransferase [Paenarthrobacter ureafaciens]|uniref:phosphoribosyltransferase n=1 Tax=Paenarthrobacter ureafaciens TaxID=37931 RepID=UPI001FB3A809|nr:phosphoribosyltransferase family protein [Paenarthrobacter ureafaciens]UOD79894.1 phosphoribosyl transferase [Paenarthrobacter ureafaciens]WNZ04764.1 phosphoribosyltransferase family protein [Paenarthrobacter ureafaciens]
MGTRFKDREEAGRRLADGLPQFRERPDTIVLGLARGGIPLAAAAAAVLYLPFGAVLVRKLGIPGRSETAFGALAWCQGDVVRILNKPLRELLLSRGVSEAAMDEVEAAERAELRRRAGEYPGIEHDLQGKTVLLVDDGLATGATMRAAVESVRAAGATSVIAAAPVASLEASTSLGRVCDWVFCLHVPGKFHAVGAFYEQFGQLTDADVMDLLKGPRARG